jgi:hypothetical protein
MVLFLPTEHMRRHAHAATRSRRDPVRARLTEIAALDVDDLGQLPAIALDRHYTDRGRSTL